MTDLKASDLPKTGMAGLTTWDAEGVQQVAMQYDLSKRGQRQAIISYYDHERSKGRTARITIQPAETLDVCQWFLQCENPATTTLPHPTLGEVPCCARCAGFVQRMDAATVRP